MANIVKILRSLIAGHVPSSLVDGQIAINQKDKKLFYPDENGAVQEFSLISSAAVSFTEVTANFGTVQNSKSNTVVSVLDASVLATSKIFCNVSGSATADHSTDEIMLLQLSAFPTNINEGVGFDIQVFTPHETYGQIKINYLITN